MSGAKNMAGLLLCVSGGVGWGGRECLELDFKKSGEGFCRRARKEGIWGLFNAQSTITVVSGRCPRGRGAQELCGCRGGYPGASRLYGLCGRKAALKNSSGSCVKAEVAVLGSLSLTVLNGLCGCKTTFAEE